MTSADVLVRTEPTQTRRISFGWEPLARLLAEPNVNDLLQAHWNELGVHKDEMPLDPDYEFMLKANETNFFMCWAARDGKTLVGYICFWVKPHMHYKSTLTAVEDLYMLSPSHREGMTGYRMFTTAIEALRQRGVKRLMLHTKVHLYKERGGLDKFFERLGFQHTDNVWSRML